MIGGTRLPLPGQEVLGFEVEHVSVRLALLALAVHSFLGVLHHLLGLLGHLRKGKTGRRQLKVEINEIILQRQQLWAKILLSCDRTDTGSKKDPRDSSE